MIDKYVVNLFSCTFGVARLTSLQNEVTQNLRLVADTFELDRAELPHFLAYTGAIARCHCRFFIPKGSDLE